MQLTSEWYSKPDDPEAGALHEAVVTVLLENGRLTLEQVLDPLLLCKHTSKWLVGSKARMPCGCN